MDNKVSKENIIYEDDETIVVLSSNPISKGHVIIQPKKKYKGLDELPEDLLYKILKLTQCYVRLLKREYSPKGYSIMQSSDEFSEPEYFELNVFPRKNKKSFSWKYSKDVETEAREFGKIKHLLKDEFKQLYK